MTVAAILNFPKFEILTVFLLYGGQYAPSCQISSKTGQTVAQIWRLNTIQIGDLPPSWICWAQIWTTHDEHLVVFSDVKTWVAIDAVVLITCSFQYLRVGLEKGYSRPEMVVCGFAPAQRRPRNSSITCRSSQSIYRWRRSAIPRIKKKKSTKKPIHVTCHVFAETTHVVAAPHAFACVIIPAT